MNALSAWISRHKAATAATVVAVFVVGGITGAGEDDDSADLRSRPSDAASESQPTTRPSESAPAASATPSVPPAAAPALPVEPAPAPSQPPPEAGTALAALSTLEVRGRAPRTDYDRGLFGQAWADADRNGCDTRNDILARDLEPEVFRGGTGDCVVQSGVLQDPFSGDQLDFLRGDGTSELVQIDHVVALSDAWQKGAQQWDPRQRVAFANDPLNLLAVDGALNAQKGDGDTATWLPPNRAFRCEYVALQVSVKVKYGLWVTQAEYDAMERILSDCPDEPLQTSDAPVIALIDPNIPDGAGQPPPPAAPLPPPAAPAPPPAAASGSCDPSYPDVCIPPPSVAGDLDCGDIEHRRFRVEAPDPHRFDGEGDGVGCET